MEKNEEKKAYDIKEDKRFKKIICVNPYCDNVWYLQLAQLNFPVQCIKCGSKWVWRIDPVL